MVAAATSNQNHSFLHKLFSMLSPKKQTHLHVPNPIPKLSPPTNQEADMARVMSRFDEDGDGKISPAELRNCMLALGEQFSMEEAEAAVESADSDGDGLLGLEDFMRLARGEGEEEKGNNLKEAFRVYELEGEGFITPRSLREALGRLGERRTVEECEVMIRRFDVDRDGVLSFDEFKMMMI
ncbi:putative calcium-binding protein CML19 [Phalaenopsis equestris]|uniref:putative calcium-binding protein CML19 n=1 Tax=Phalaenopsis equestris TaxID=78828 RepID=UPI0009E45DB0|nr:putative calcium-binding protein CML19 [Phalaenopsis equestris]